MSECMGDTRLLQDSEFAEAKEFEIAFSAIFHVSEFPLPHIYLFE